MTLLSRNLVLTALSFGSVAAIVIACGSEESTFKDGDGDAGGPGIFPEAGLGEGGGQNQIDITKDDPFPKWCGPTENKPPQVTGTAECPDDKNLPGCGCNKRGDTAPCWTYRREFRGLGDCKDGTTTCVGRNETTNVWGPCEGEVKPDLTKTGAAACTCFSAGKWKIENTSPCLRELGGSYWSHSTVQDFPADGQVGYCTQEQNAPAGQVPNAPGKNWSRSTLKVDCSGKFKMCFRIKQGDYLNPKKEDCVLGEVCIDTPWLEKDVETPLPPLPLWAGGATPEAQQCAKKWESAEFTPPDKSPGYGEMIVKGQTVYCDEIDDGAGNDFVFNRIQYCPRVCRPSNANLPGGYQPDSDICKTCRLSGEGQF
jgi:hypothetical protein